MCDTTWILICKLNNSIYIYYIAECYKGFECDSFYCYSYMELHLDYKLCNILNKITTEYIKNDILKNILYIYYYISFTTLLKYKIF